MLHASTLIGLLLLLGTVLESHGQRHLLSEENVCGDGVQTSGEQCDDGNTNFNDGCSGTCSIECGYTCNPGPNVLSVCTAECGGGEYTTGEECDDGNIVDGDGCSSTCTIEEGWECPITQRIEFFCGVRTCSEICGNNIKSAGFVPCSFSFLSLSLSLSLSLCLSLSASVCLCLSLSDSV